LSSPAAVVFDCDGLLVETESRWTIAEVELFERYGRTFTDEHKRAILGKSLHVAGGILEELLDQPGRGLELWDELVDLVEPLMHEAEPMPGARDLVAALAHLPVAVASSSNRRLVDAALAAAGLTFDVTVAGDEVAHPKPAPDLYLEACRLLDVEPRSAIALEDSGTGVASARAAGLYVIGVPSLPGVELDADLVAESLTDAGIHRALGVKSPGPAADDGGTCARRSSSAA
jgi:HAD superfamily hydrolase (TIGR01509 family)